MPGEHAITGGGAPAAAGAAGARPGGVHRLLGMAPPGQARVRFAGQMPPVGFRYAAGGPGAGRLSPPLPGFASAAWDAAAERGAEPAWDAPARPAARGDARAQAEAWDDWTADEMQHRPPAPPSRTAQAASASLDAPAASGAPNAPAASVAPGAAAADPAGRAEIPDTQAATSRPARRSAAGAVETASARDAADATSPAPAAAPAAMPAMTPEQAAALGELRARMRALAAPSSQEEPGDALDHEPGSQPSIGHASDSRTRRAPSSRRADAPARAASPSPARSVPEAVEPPRAGKADSRVDRSTRGGRADDGAASPEIGRSQTAAEAGSGGATPSATPAMGRSGAHHSAGSAPEPASGTAAADVAAAVRLSIPGVTGRREVFAALSRHLATAGGLNSAGDDDLWDDAAPSSGSRRPPAGARSATSAPVSPATPATPAAQRMPSTPAAQRTPSSPAAAAVRPAARGAGERSASAAGAETEGRRGDEAPRAASPVRVRAGAERAEPGDAPAKPEAPRRAPAPPAETVIVIHRTAAPASRMPRGVASRSTVRGRHLRPLR